MGATLPDSVTRGQPHPVAISAYGGGMDVKLVVRDNVRRLLGLAPGSSGVAELMRRSGLKNGSAQRVLAGETSIGLDLLADLARSFGLEPWQLLIEGLDPERLPQIHHPSSRWPFRQIDQDAVASLSGTQAQAVEIGLIAAMTTAGAALRKPAARAA